MTREILLYWASRPREGEAFSTVPSRTWEEGGSEGGGEGEREGGREGGREGSWSTGYIQGLLGPLREIPADIRCTIINIEF